jgi:hypothetical protein
MDQIGRRVVLPIMVVAILALTLAVAVLGVRSIALLTDKVGRAGARPHRARRRSRYSL